jgi:hypothetical protein
VQGPEFKPQCRKHKSQFFMSLSLYKAHVQEVVLKVKILKNCHQNNRMSWVPMANTCNPSYWEKADVGKIEG